ncbi:hypothetical protein N0B31_08985 [Salinirubellus salinus]|uniref:Uncharacterized protein n=1 Tax=Salinirubellus salinus TaxID=1364945 RepID=A0A9E7R6W1_9EURY|nr:hypothetical protein [Salinirubellus salinus]UWM56413.1 hypothetical protein N0B31_08985 [Salinirubellus salinus]
MSPPEARIVGPAGEAAIAAAEECLGGRLRTVVVYDEADYEVRYVSDVVRAQLGEAGVRETAAQLHGYVHLDFVERDLFADLTPTAGDVRTTITRLDRVTFVRYLVEDAGVFLSVAPDADLTALCAAMDEAVEGARDDTGDA